MNIREQPDGTVLVSGTCEGCGAPFVVSFPSMATYNRWRETYDDDTYGITPEQRRFILFGHCAVCLEGEPWKPIRGL